MNIPAELRAILKKEASNVFDIRDDAKLTELGLDSLAVIEIIFAIEEKFRIEIQPNNEQIAQMTFRDLCDVVEVQRLRATATAAPSQPQA
jgi:acyl carrier protein